VVYKSRFSKRINITIEPDFLNKVDAAAKHYDAPRSVIIRLALHDWLDKHAVPEKPKIQNVAKDFKKLADKYPKINPNDHELLKFLDDYHNNRL
jgi:metal-responsive CopG/Arc/MetJ family transcriptional regulator